MCLAAGIVRSDNYLGKSNFAGTLHYYAGSLDEAAIYAVPLVGGPDRRPTTPSGSMAR